VSLVASDQSTTPVDIHRLESPEEYRAVEAVQREAWGFTSDSPVPAPIQRAINDNGGLVLGAFAGSELIGFTFGFVGREEGKLFHYSHMTAVRPPWQNRHVGLALKSRQREEVLRQGLDEVRWTYDPLQSKNAGLNVRRLGGRPDRYLPHYYGVMADAINQDLETDRVRLVWQLNDPRVEERLRGHLPLPTNEEDRLRSSEPLIETARGPNGVRQPMALRAPSSLSLNLEIPADLASARARDRDEARHWREATREAFMRALAAGYTVDDFAVVSLGDERRSFYFLERRPEAGAA